VNKPNPRGIPKATNGTKAIRRTVLDLAAVVMVTLVVIESVMGFPETNIFRAELMLR
jgi:hypothetical protein